jgi:hypothetical protein
VLRYNLELALSRASKVVRGLRQGLTEARALRRRRPLARLSEEARPSKAPT